MLGENTLNERFKKIKNKSWLCSLEVEEKMKNITAYTTKNNMLDKFGTYQKEHPGKATLRMQNKM